MNRTATMFTLKDSARAVCLTGLCSAACGLNTFGLLEEGSGLTTDTSAESSTSASTQLLTGTSGTATSGDTSTTTTGGTDLSESSGAHVTTGDVSTGDVLPVCSAAIGALLPPSHGWSNPGREYINALTVSGSQLTAGVKLFMDCDSMEAQHADFGGQFEYGDAGYGALLKYDLELGYLSHHVFAGTNAITIGDVATDGSGNLYVIGVYKNAPIVIPPELGSADGDPLGDPPAGGYRGFIAVFDAVGEHVWSSDELDSTGSTHPLTVIPRGDGGLVVSGYYRGQPAFAPCPSIAADDDTVAGSFVTAFRHDVNAPNGPFVRDWTYCPAFVDLDTLQSVIFHDIVATTGGEVVAVGQFRGGVLAFDGFGDMDEQAEADEDSDALIVALDQEGEYLWHDIPTIEGAGAEVLRAVARSPEGQVVAVGGDNVDDPMLPHTGGIVKAFHVDPAQLVPVFEKRLRIFPEDPDRGSLFHAVEVAPCGEIVVAGYAHGLAIWQDEDEAIGAGDVGGTDVMIAKLGPGGEHRWGRRFGSQNPGDGAYAVAIDPESQEIFLGGEYNGEVTVEDGTMWPAPLACNMKPGVSFQDAFLIRLSP